MDGTYREKSFISVTELSNILGVSRTYAYQIVAGAECGFNVVRMGKRFIIPTNSFFKWYDSLKD